MGAHCSRTLNIAVNDFDAKNSGFSWVLLGPTELVVSGTPCMIDADYYRYKFLQNFLAAICDLSYYRPQRSCYKVMFSQECHSVHGGGWVWQTATAADSTHPTGMHSC